LGLAKDRGDLKTKEDLKGFWIERVLPGSPAEKAGLLPGDQFVWVEGKEMTSGKNIHHTLKQKGCGNDIRFTIIREGMKKNILVKLPLLKE
jgi:regulator of sigma E protease